MKEFYKLIRKLDDAVEDVVALINEDLNVNDYLHEQYGSYLEDNPKQAIIEYYEDYINN